MNYPRRPLHEILRLTAAEVPDRPATAFLGAHLTFAQLKEQSDKFAAALRALGVRQDDRVGIMLPNCPQYIIAAFAVLRLGAVVVNVNPLYTPREVAVVAKDSGMRVLLTLDVLAPVTLAVREQTGIEHVIVTSVMEYSAAAAPCPAVEGTQRLADLLAVGRRARPALRGDRARGRGRAAIHRRDDGRAEGRDADAPQHLRQRHPDRLLGARELRRGEDSYLLVIPYFHIYGFTVGMMEGVWRGAQQILIPKYDVEMLLTPITRLPADLLPGRPDDLHLAAQSPAGEGVRPRPGPQLQQRLGPAARRGHRTVRAPDGRHSERGLRPLGSFARHAHDARARPAQAGQHRPAAARHRHQDR